MFQKGKSGNPAGGALGNKGGGRPPDWLKTKCQDIFEKRDLISFVAQVASGDPVQAWMGSKDAEGEEMKVVVKISADVKDRLKASEMLKDWGFGKSPQAVELSGGVQVSLVDLLVKARAARELAE